MIDPIADLVRDWSRRRVLVIGEAMLDAYVQGSADRVSREAPVPIVAMQRRRDLPGGAANAAVNVAALGGTVELLSVIGADEDGRRLRAALREANVACSDMVEDPPRQTLVKQRLMADGQLLLRLDSGTTAPLSASAEAALLQRLERAWTDVDAVIVSDYGYGILTEGCLRAIRRLQARRPRILLVDARDLSRYRGVGVTAVKPNYHEASDLLGLDQPRGTNPRDEVRRAEWIARGARLLHRRTGAALIAVTLDTEGTLLIRDGEIVHRTACRPAPNQRAVGAGDTFAAAMTLALTAGADPRRAVDLAASAAAVAVAKPDTAICSIGELRAALGMLGKHLEDAGELAGAVALLRAGGKRIVFTNGCFDVLHRGHLSYLHQARSLGDALIVGVNSDDGVRRLKGMGRPLNPLEDRLELLAGLSCVDHVIAFDEDTPAALIEVVAPEVYAKGGDYTRERLPEAEQVERLGGEVVLLPLVDDRSTTRLIERAQSAGLVAAAGRPGT